MRWNSFKDMQAWIIGMQLIDVVYGLTASFPIEERYGLTSQIRRSVVSVPSNIAEGSARYGNKQLILFLSYALGSLAELETQLLIAEQCGYLSIEEIPETQIKACRITVHGMIKKLNHK